MTPNSPQCADVPTHSLTGSTKSKKWLRRWVIWAAMCFAWVAGVVYNMVVGFLTSAVKDGVCYGYVIGRRCRTLYTSGFADDDMFSRNGPTARYV